nr:MBL fold metallo-hydrolase [Gemmatimonadaceae bacterium]
MDVRGLTVGPFEENCWIVADPAAGEAVCIDPGDEGARILASIAETGCRLTAIWLTHAHLDHVGAIADVLAVHDVPVLLHAADLPLYRTVDRQAARFGLRMVAPPEPTTAAT